MRESSSLMILESLVGTSTGFGTSFSTVTYLSTGMILWMAANLSKSMRNLVSISMCPLS